MDDAVVHMARMGTVPLWLDTEEIRVVEAQIFADTAVGYRCR